jgi:hypothetical protein
MRAATLVIVIAFAAILASANIPPGPPTATTTPEPETECDNYVAVSLQDRTQQWITTLQSGLIKNPDLPQETWTCVMDLDKIMVTDQFVFDVCTKDSHAAFTPVVFKALEYHLAQCEISIERN